MKIRKIDFRNIKGFKVGNAENIDKGTGCTVIICEEGAVAGVDVRGGAPATRETDLIKSENTVNTVNAVVISGGSAFGLEAASGVMRELADRDIGFDSGYGKVPIVCGASLFDLTVGDTKAFPDVEMGREAVRNAYEGNFDHGNRGAGTGASVGKFRGINRAMKSGLGTFACGDDFIQVGAVVAVNAMGDVYNGAGNIIAGLRSEDGVSIYGSIKSLKPLVHNMKDSAEPASEEIENNGFRQEEKQVNKQEIADAIKNAFKNKKEVMMVTGRFPKIDNAASEPEPELKPEPEPIIEIEQEPVTETIQDAVYDAPIEAEPVHQIPESTIEPQVEAELEIEIKEEVEAEAANEAQNEVEAETETESINQTPIAEFDDDDDQGYDIAFNTTIGCLITNAKFTKAQANKLASILHDAYARAIKPVHSTMDGDTIFVLTTAEQEVNFDAFAALATDVMQYAIIDAATSAKSAYGLPAACDILK